MNIVIIGTGNVAHVFGKLLVHAGHTVSQVYGRSRVASGLLAASLGAKGIHSWNDITREADIYLFALSDHALQELPALTLENKVVFHTAGSVSIDVLKHLSANYGVVYPLQSLRKDMPVPARIPLLVNASNEQTQSRLAVLARSISADIRMTTDHERLQYHVAAVFVNNFTNHLYAVAESFCRQEGIAFSLLFPLAAETTERIETVSPAKVVTGPAIRNDQATIQQHLDLLDKYPFIRDLYAQLTTSMRLLHMPAPLS